MKYPKIKSAEAIDPHNLIIEFDNGEKRKYDIRPLLKKEVFSTLKNYGVFKNFQIEKGGYAIIWNEDLDISENELWVHGLPV